MGVAYSVEHPTPDEREAYREANTAGVDDAPAVRAVERIHAHAVAAGASDIHIEPIRGGGGVRTRVDGILCEAHRLATDVYLPVVSRIKLLAGMDIADRRQPQDGRYEIAVYGRTLDARVSSMPTLEGEKLVIRLLDARASAPRIDTLGMNETLLDEYRSVLRLPYGLVAVAGPTGSGKTTTLYASVQEIASPARSICSVEDPVEMRIDGVAQVQVNAKAGLGFAPVLRSFLRQDPNVIMIGEIRDGETGAVGIAAALSGQLILTTVHSNDAPRTIERFVELGITRPALAAGLRAIVSQRLVRKLCTACRRPARLGAGVYEAAGCAACDQTGYAGRCGVFELFEIDDELRDAIAEGASSATLAAIGARGSYRPMLVDADEKLAAGATSADELRRVLAWGR